MAEKDYGLTTVTALLDYDHGGNRQEVNNAETEDRTSFDVYSPINLAASSL